MTNDSLFKQVVNTINKLAKKVDDNINPSKIHVLKISVNLQIKILGKFKELASTTRRYQNISNLKENKLMEFFKNKKEISVNVIMEGQKQLDGL